MGMAQTYPKASTPKMVTLLTVDRYVFVNLYMYIYNYIYIYYVESQKYYVDTYTVIPPEFGQWQ